MKYKLQNLRLGFANNSSSSHSIVLLPPGAQTIPQEWQYGWDWFLLVKEEDKKKYFATQLFGALRHDLGDQIARIVTKDLFQVEIPEDAYVDHQSQFVTPTYINGTAAIDFLKDLGIAMSKDPKVGVQGGNDNSDGEAHLPSKFRNTPGSKDGRKPPTVRKENDGTWIMFNPENGAKTRFSPEWVEINNRKSDTPELVDIKITDFCDIGCAFCYQDSTPKGTHCDPTNFQNLMYSLSNLNVFEIAIGGGEPTMHPKFANFLYMAKQSKIIPNFTTRSTKWMKDPEIVKAVMENVGSFAFSCSTLADAENLYKTLSTINTKIAYDRQLLRKCQVQVIAGVTSGSELKKIAEFVNDNFSLPLTILGYKEVGRGPKFNKVPITLSEIRDAFEDWKWAAISVDSALLKQFPEINQTKTCDNLEGTHSMYIDLVGLSMQESSYSGVPIKIIETVTKYNRHIDWVKNVKNAFDMIGRVSVKMDRVRVT